MLADRLKNEAGYSLVEVMAAIIILALAILPMVGMFDAGLRSATQGSSYDQAREFANEKLEEVRALPYNKTSPANTNDSAVELYPPGTPKTETRNGFASTMTTRYYRYQSGTLTPVANTPVAPMMQITVRVDWGENNSYTTTGFTASGAES